MKIDSAILQNFSKEKYLAYIRSFPSFKEEKVQSYATVILTLLAISIFGIFAIAPTLGTIVQLRKTLADDQFLDNELQTKIKNMSRLQEEYLLLSPQLPLIYAAVPKTSDESNLAGKIRALAFNSTVRLQQLSVNSVEIATNKKNVSALTPILLTISVQGELLNLQKFTNGLVNLDRMVTIDAINFSTLKTQNGSLYQMSLEAKSYYRL